MTTSRVPDTRPLVADLDAEAHEAAIPGLAELLIDAVEGGASVNFLAGVTTAQAAAWWSARRGVLAPTTCFGKDLRGG